MKSKNNLFFSVLCLVVCTSLVVGAVHTGNLVSSLVSALGLRFSYIKQGAVSGELSLNSAVYEKTAEVFSPEGFGGGGYFSQAAYTTPADILKLMEGAESVYAGLKKSGEIKEQQFGSGSANESFGDVDISNKTDKEISIKELLNTTPQYKTITKDEPYILVYHTHTTEGYELLDKGWYSNAFVSRTKNSAKNMVRVGEELVKELETAGYNVIHDKTVYDASYDGAYSRSLVSVEKYLKAYPSIVLTLDVHRDAIHYSDGTKSKPTAVINGKKAAQVMIISGCEGEGVEDFPQWKKNLTFSVHLQNKIEEENEGLMRPIMFCHRKYNMNVTPCSVLLEFGTDANTLEEAVYSASLVGRALSDMLDKELL